MAVRNINAFQLKVSARGALIRACFGSTSMYWAVVLSGNPTPLRFSIIAVPAVSLIGVVSPPDSNNPQAAFFRHRLGSLEIRPQVLLA
jgi:hypothetical protein